jgi:hypothetical protein
MKADEKKNLIDALNFLYGVSAKAPVEKVIHDNCFNAAKEILSQLEKIELEE